MGHLKMSQKERRRVEMLSRVRDGQLTLAKAAELMGVGYRQAKRLNQRYRAQSDAGLVHGLRGRAGNRAIAPEHRAQIVALYQAQYADYGPTLAAECLMAEHGLAVQAETLRGWLMAAGLWRRRLRHAQHRQWRQPKEHLGEMVQMDGSDHDWFEGRGERCSLMVMIDDAPNRTLARLFPAETTAAAFEVFWCYAERYGLPLSLYVDKSSIYRTTREASVDEQLADEAPLTQFGRAMNELDVTLKLAHSPQAKGRVERRNRLFQDRLVKALRRAGINDMAAANAFLDSGFLDEINQRWSHEPAAAADLHRALAADVDLARVLGFQESRVVQPDWTIRWRRRHFQIKAQDASRGLVGQRVVVLEQLDGTIRLLYRGRELTWKELEQRPSRPAAEPPPGPTSTPPKPAADHPWRGRMLPRKAA